MRRQFKRLASWICFGDTGPHFAVVPFVYRARAIVFGITALLNLAAFLCVVLWAVWRVPGEDVAVDVSVLCVFWLALSLPTYLVVQPGRIRVRLRRPRR